ncbi:tRNA 2-thiocytidine biosynthesis TtcA domain protein, partial [Vibrio harveyi]
HLRCLISC